MPRKLCGSRLQKGHLRHGTRSTWSAGTQSWSLQPLKSLYVFTQIAKWWQQLVMLTNSRCLLGLCINWRCSAAMWPQVILLCTALRAGQSLGERGPSRRVAKSLILAESQSRESRLWDSARLCQPCWAHMAVKPACTHACAYCHSMHTCTHVSCSTVLCPSVWGLGSCYLYHLQSSSTKQLFHHCDRIKAEQQQSDTISKAQLI